MKHIMEEFSKLIDDVLNYRYADIDYLECITKLSEICHDDDTRAYRIHRIKYWTNRTNKCVGQSNGNRDFKPKERSVFFGLDFDQMDEWKSHCGAIDWSHYISIIVHEGDWTIMRNDGVFIGWGI